MKFSVTHENMLSLSLKMGSLGPQNGDITASLADWPGVVAGSPGKERRTHRAWEMARDRSYLAKLVKPSGPWGQPRKLLEDPGGAREKPKEEPGSRP